MFYHSWKYISLIQDIFGILGNQFTMTENGKNEVCELDFNTDDILQENALLGFHEAGPNVNKQLTSYATEYSKMTGSK